MHAKFFLLLFFFFPSVSRASICQPVLEAIWADSADLKSQVANQLARLTPRGGGDGLLHLHTENIFTENFSRELFDTLKGRMSTIDQHLKKLLPNHKALRTVEIPPNVRGPVKVGELTQMTETEAKVFQEYAAALVAQMNTNGWGEQFAVESIGVRLGTPDIPMQIGMERHPDNSYMTVSLTLLGTGMVRETPSGWKPVPRGETVVFNGTKRSGPMGQTALLHAAPGNPEERLTVLIRLKKVTP